MTQPTVVYFGPDAPTTKADQPPPKLFLRTLLYSTGKRGRMIESMHARLSRNETVQSFNIWAYGERDLVRGSGLYVGEQGVSANHHFLTPKDGNTFKFIAGKYKFELFAKTLGSRDEIRIWSEEFVVSKEHEAELQENDAGLYFDWAPNSRSYLPHVDTRPPKPNPSDLLNLILPTEAKPD